MSCRDRSFSVRAAAAVVACAVAIVVLGLAGRAVPAGATLADGDIVLGKDVGLPCTVGTDGNCSNTPTGIANVTGATGADAFRASAKAGDGVVGHSDLGSGVYGDTTSGGSGVWGYTEGSGNGVYGENAGSGNALVGYASGPGYGLFVKSDNATGGHIETPSRYGAGLEVNIYNTANARGAVEAETTGDGPGLQGQSDFGGPGVKGIAFGSGVCACGVWGSNDDTGGIGVYANSKKGTALKAQGKSTFNGITSFQRSGTLTVTSGTNSAPGPTEKLTASSLVLATIQGNVAGVWVQGVTLVTGSKGSFTIHLNKLAPSNITVAWFIVN